MLDPAKAGIGSVAYVTVGLSSHTKAAQEAFERAIARAPEVRGCHNITGSVEYLSERIPKGVPRFSNEMREITKG